MKKKKPVPREGADWSPTPRRSIRRSLIATGWTPLLRATLPGSGLIQWTFLKGSHAATGEGRTEADALAEAYAAAKKHDERRGAP